MIRRGRGSSIEDLKLRREEEKSRQCHIVEVITMDLIQVGFEAILSIVGP